MKKPFPRLVHSVIAEAVNRMKIMHYIVVNVHELNHIGLSLNATTLMISRTLNSGLMALNVAVSGEKKELITHGKYNHKLNVYSLNGEGADRSLNYINNMLNDNECNILSL